jgi:glycosyltransferase involved in cell wall biosynthesis
MARAMEVTATVSTKDRYWTTLPLCLQAIALQTVRPKQVVLFDDGEMKDLRALSPYSHLFPLLIQKGINWFHLPGGRKGQVANHQTALDRADTEFVWRVDDDEVPEPDCLARLLEVASAEPAIGAVAGLVIDPKTPSQRPAFVTNKLADILSGLNCQWGFWEKDAPEDVEHLYSTFLYRVAAARQAGGYSRDLSPVGHREETLFSHAILRAGYRLVVTPRALTWHLREATGGIRAFKDPSLWARDEEVFKRQLAAWGVTALPYKFYVLDNGLGDHIVFRSILPELAKAYPDHRLVVAASYPEVFEGVARLTLVSIADAKSAFGDLSRWNIYQWCEEHNWKRPLAAAFRALYL